MPSAFPAAALAVPIGDADLASFGADLPFGMPIAQPLDAAPSVPIATPMYMPNVPVQLGIAAHGIDRALAFGAARRPLPLVSAPSRSARVSALFKSLSVVKTLFYNRSTPWRNGGLRT